MRMNCKRDKNEAGSELCKLLMNSLYGKLAEREFPVKFFTTKSVIDDYD